ncbi:MAG: amino acid ABC transporter substrate-binding protein [Pseudomonadota bacterium]
MKNKVKIGLLALVLGLSLATVGTAQAAEELTFGCAVPLTGIFGKDGELVRDAYTIWMETVNAKGGIGGKYKIRIIFYDDQSNPQTSAKLIEKLIKKDKVDLLLGGFGSSQVMAASAAAERHKYPLISGAAASNKLYERGFKYYFGTLGKATEEVRGCVDVFTVVSPKPKTVAIVGANIPFCAQACEGYKKYAKKDGFEVVHFELFPLKLQDYNTMLEKAKAKNPDILLVGSHLGVSLRVMKALKEIDFSPKAVAFSYGPTVPAFVEGLKGDAEYVFAASEWTPNLAYKGPVFGTAEDFNRAYKERFGRFPDYVEAATAGGAVILQTAVEQLGLKPGIAEADREKLMERLHELDLMTFYGQIHFGKDGANVAHPPVAVQVQDGKLANVFPANAAEAKPRYPMPPWKSR